jgi:hypothetical protein
MNPVTFLTGVLLVLWIGWLVQDTLRYLYPTVHDWCVRQNTQRRIRAVLRDYHRECRDHSQLARVMCNPKWQLNAWRRTKVEAHGVLFQGCNRSKDLPKAYRVMGHYLDEQLKRYQYVESN